MNFYIIITGPLGAGKTTVCEMLKVIFGDRMVYVSTSDLIRQELREQCGIEQATREQLSVHVRLRRRQLVEYWSDKILNWAEANLTDKIVVIDNFRTPADVDYITERFRRRTMVVGVKAHKGIRVRRVEKRTRVGDPKGRKLRTAMRADQRSSGVSGFNVPGCIGQAEILLNGNLSLEKVREQVARLAARIDERLAGMSNG